MHSINTFIVKGKHKYRKHFNHSFNPLQYKCVWRN